jgi:MATE family multidrug resistance protein
LAFAFQRLPAILAGRGWTEKEQRMQAVGEELPADTAQDHSRWLGMSEVVRLAVPMVLNTVSFTIMQFVDRWMVSRVPDNIDAMSAQLAGGMAAFTMVCFFIGLLSCVSTFASQNLGAGRPERSALYGWQGLWLSGAGAGALAVVIVLARPLMGLFGHPAAVLDLEVPYFQILLGGAIFTLSSTALGSFFVGLHKPLVPLIAGVAGNLVNFVAAYVLIFGKAGFPAMGLFGAGVGHVLGMSVQAIVMFVLFVAGGASARYQVRRQCRFSWTAMRDLARLGTPAGGMFVGDLLMWTIFMGYIVGRFGEAAMTATNILNGYWQFCFMPAIGVSAAATALVGRYCGAGQPRLAWRRAHASLILVEAYMVTAGVVMWLWRDDLVDFFNKDHDPQVQAIATQVFIFILLCQAFDALNVVFIGALRGAGDTLWPGAVQIGLAYGVGLGASAVVAHVRPEWGSFGPWSAASIYIAVLGLVMWGRFLRGKWRTMTVVEAPVPQVQEPAFLPPL